MQQVQAVLFSRKRFLLAAQARQWLREHGYAGTINESDPEVWEFEQAPRSHFRGQLTIEPVQGQPGVSLRCVRESSPKSDTKARRARYGENPKHPSHTVDLEVLVDDGDGWRVVFYRTDLGQALADVKHLVKGKGWRWQVRKATTGEVVAKDAQKTAGKRKAAEKRTAKKTAKKTVKRKAAKKRTAKKTAKKTVKRKVAKKRTAKKTAKKTVKRKVAKNRTAKKTAKAHRAERSERRYA